MSEIEMAKESIEQAHEHAQHEDAQHELAGHEHAKGGWGARKTAVVIAMLAGALAIAEFGARDAQTAYLSYHVASSDTWSQYQGKSTRRTGLIQSADILESLPTASDEAVRQKVDAARKSADRMRSEPGADGMEQLAARAEAQEHVRDHEMHRYHGLEMASSGLQLAIVLASVSVVTSSIPLLVGAGILGAAAALYGLVAGFSLV